MNKEYNKLYSNSQNFNKILRNINLYDIKKTMENIIEKPLLLNIILPKVSELIDGKHQMSKLTLEQA